MNLLKRFAAPGSIALLAFAVVGSATAAPITTLNGTLASPGGLTSPADPTPAPGFFNGSGNGPDNFTIVTDGSLQLALGVREQFGASTTPEPGTSNYNESTATHNATYGTTTYTLAAWDYYFSINTGSANTVNEYNYSLSITDLETNVTGSYNPTTDLPDNSGYGPSGVHQGTLNITSDWIAQNAENIGFGGPFNPNDAYLITLSALNTQTHDVVDSVAVTVNAPEPGTVALMLGSLGVMAFMVRRRRTN